MADKKPATSTDKKGEVSGTSGALNVALHPLVLINISDHFTRTKVSSKNANPRVIGALLGVQTGRNVEIFTSFELVFNTNEGLIKLDLNYLKAKQEQFRKVFPTYDFLGWYSTGIEAQVYDIDIQKQVLEFNESPLYLVLNPHVSPTAKELPITIYESELHVINDKPTMMFAKTSYKIETMEAERISVDHVAHVTPGSGDTDGSRLITHLTSLHNAIKMLNLRIKIIQQFLRSIQKGDIPKDHGLLRQVASLCNRLPAINTNNFKEDFLNEYNDALLITYLATITKGTSSINELVEKFNISYDRHTRRRFPA